MKGISYAIISVFGLTACIALAPNKFEEDASKFEKVEANQIYWKESWRAGVAGVYHSGNKMIEWRECFQAGVACVMNPETEELEWKKSWHHGIAGVYNPTTKQVEWKESWKTGIVAISTFENTLHDFFKFVPRSFLVGVHFSMTMNRQCVFR